MELFDFNRHYDRIRKATTDEEIAAIRQEYDAHYAALSEVDREIVVLRLREHAREEVIRSKALIEFVNEVMSAERESV